MFVPNKAYESYRKLALNLTDPPTHSGMDIPIYRELEFIDWEDHPAD